MDTREGRDSGMIVTLTRVAIWEVWCKVWKNCQMINGIQKLSVDVEYVRSEGLECRNELDFDAWTVKWTN